MLTRYVPKFLIAGLAGTLATVAVFATAAAPAGAKVVCTPLPTYPYLECYRQLSSLKVKLVKQKHGYKVVIKIGDPSIALNVKLYRKGKFVRTVFSGNVEPGTVILHVHPHKAGKYRLQVKGSEGGVTIIRNKHFKIKRV